MPKKTATDIVNYAEQYLASAESRESQREAVIAVGLFSLSGFIIMGLAVEIIHQSLRAATPVYMAHNSVDYAAQQAFYASGEVLHGSAPQIAQAHTAVHAAAQATQALPVIWLAGGTVLLAGLWLLETNGFFKRHRPEFTIHKIK